MKRDLLPSGSPLRIVLAYALFGTLWIIFSDLLMVQLVPEPLLKTVSVAKGWLFIGVTALLLYLLIGRRLAEMVRVTAESREREERLRLLEDNLPDSYVYQYVHGADGTPRFLYLSAGAEKLHGVNREDVLRDAGTLHRQIDPEQMPSLAAAEAASLQTLTDFQMELRMCCADGKWRWLRVKARPFRRSDGKIVWDGMATDITERKRVEESLRRSEEALAGRVEILQKIFDNVPAMICFIDQDGRMVMVNREFERVFGWTLAEIHAHPDFFADCYPDPDYRAGVLAFIREGTGTFAEFRSRIRDGSLIDTTFASVLLADGTSIGIGMDITGRKQTEEALRAYRDTLERLVGERTQELEETKLALMNIVEDLSLKTGELAERTTQLEAVNRELESFSYSVSHDLRAPLRHIDGFSHALQEECGSDLSEECRGFLGRIRTASGRMWQLIDAMLQLAHLSRKALSREKVDVSSLAAEIVAELRNADPERAVAVDIEEGLAAKGDGALLRVLLENLISNAWKYTAKRPEARIEIGAMEDDGAKFFFVRDNGAGFDPQYEQKLFVPFQRLHSDRDFEGIGIGLATVKRIVNRHGGSIWAESRPGEGATFSFTLGGKVSVKPESIALASRSSFPP